MRVGVIAMLGCAVGMATTAARAQEGAPVDPDQDVQVPHKAHFAMRASAGVTGLMLFDSRIIGGQASIGAGVDSSVGSYGLAFNFFGGKVEGDLTALHAAFGFYMDWPVSILHFGLQPQIGYIGIERFTTDRQFGAYTFGLAGRAAIDLVKGDGFTFALGLEPKATVLAAIGNDGLTADSAAPLLGGSAFLEMRWRRPEL